MMRGFWAAFLLIFSLIAQAAKADEEAMKEAVQVSQRLMASGDFAKANEHLVAFERSRPKAREFPLYCYQRFFIAIHGLGDRSLAREFLIKLTDQVQSGKLLADSPEFQSVSNAWYREMQFTDSDLPRQNAIRFAKYESQVPKGAN
jgi:hypothetical protein